MFYFSQEGNEIVAMYQTMMEGYMTGIELVKLPPKEKLELPCIVGMLGSGTGFFEVLN